EVEKNISSRGKIPIYVGGTGMYVDALIRNYKNNAVFEDEEYKTELELLTLEQLQLKLKTENSKLFDSLNNSDRNNPYRLKRLLIKIRTNKSKKTKEKRKKNNKSEQFGDIIMLYKKIDRNALKIRI